MKFVLIKNFEYLGYSEVLWIFYVDLINEIYYEIYYFLILIIYFVYKFREYIFNEVKILI